MQLVQDSSYPPLYIPLLTQGQHILGVFNNCVVWRKPLDEVLDLNPETSWDVSCDVIRIAYNM